MKIDSEINNLSICLIGGTGRSGTTILKNVFNNHPEVANITEWRITIDPDGLIGFYNTFSSGWSPFLYDIKIRRLERLLKDVGKNYFINKLYRYGLRVTGLEQRIPYKLDSRYSVLDVEKYVFSILYMLIN